MYTIDKILKECFLEINAKTHQVRTEERITVKDIGVLPEMVLERFNIPRVRKNGIVYNEGETIDPRIGTHLEISCYTKQNCSVAIIPNYKRCIRGYIKEYIAPRSRYTIGGKFTKKNMNHRKYNKRHLSKKGKKSKSL